MMSLGIIRVDFEVTGKLMILYFAFVKCLRKKLEYTVFIDLKKI